MTAATAQLWFAFLLGGSSFFAPCAYPLLPGYLAYFLGTADSATAGAGATGGAGTAGVVGTGGTAGTLGTVGRAAGIGLLVSLGFWLVYAVLGGLVLAVGTAALQDIILLELVVGPLLVVLGTAMAAGRTPSFRISLPERRRSKLGFVLFGVVYAVAAAGCTALLSFSVVVGALTADPMLGLWTLLSYVAGMSAVMVAVTVAAGLGKDAILRRLSANTGRIERVAGVLLVVAGLAQIYLFLFRFDGLALLGL
jgi:cytochrome c-type biogenesis protein